MVVVVVGYCNFTAAGNGHCSKWAGTQSRTPGYSVLSKILNLIYFVYKLVYKTFHPTKVHAVRPLSRWAVYASAFEHRTLFKLATITRSSTNQRRTHWSNIIPKIGWRNIIRVVTLRPNSSAMMCVQLYRSHDVTSPKQFLQWGRHDEELSLANGCTCMHVSIVWHQRWRPI